MDVDTNNSKILAGIFKTISSDNKKLEPFIDDFVEKTHKLETQLKSTIVIFSSFIDSFKRISEKSFKKRKGFQKFSHNITSLNSVILFRNIK